MSSLRTRNSGAYRHYAKLYRQQSRRDFRDNDREFVRDLWVSVEPKASSEQNVADQMEAMNRYELRTHWNPEAITPDMEIETQRHTFAIGGVVNVDEADHEFLLTATKTGEGFG